LADAPLPQLGKECLVGLVVGPLGRSGQQIPPVPRQLLRCTSVSATASSSGQSRSEGSDKTIA